MGNQLRSHDQRLFSLHVHRKNNPSISHNRDFKPLTSFRGCTAWFVSDMVRNPEERFSHGAAQFV